MVIHEKSRLLPCGTSFTLGREGVAFGVITSSAGVYWLDNADAFAASLFLSPRFLRGRHERRDEFFVEGEEVLDALAVVLKWLRSVAEVNDTVEFGVSFDERGRHRQRVVEVGHGAGFHSKERGMGGY